MIISFFDRLTGRDDDIASVNLKITNLIILHERFNRLCIR